MEIDIMLQEELINALTTLSVGPAWYESGAAVAVASGLVAVIGGMVSHIFNQRSGSKRRDSERKSMQLEHDNRKVEKMHDAQVEALKALSAINEDLLPTVWPSPGHDSSEAYSEVVWNMHGLLNHLDQYLKQWSYVLPENIIRQIRDIIVLCDQGHWGKTITKNPEYQHSKKELESAEKIVNDLGSAIVSLKQLLGLKVHNSITNRK